MPLSMRTETAVAPSAVRIAVVVPVWRQARYLAAAVRSALKQDISCGVGVVIVDDGCPEPATDRVARALRDATPDRVAYRRQPNRGVSAARNAGIRHACARWPQVKAIFPLDADNELSPHTLAKLSAYLEENPEAAWASPTLEFFGSEEGEWQTPGPYLPFRQRFANQCDTGTLVRRELFDAGLRFDETNRYGFEDWEFFLGATLAGYRGLLVGRCGFRYRRRGDSMLDGAMQRAERLEAWIRENHPEAFEPEALARLEHAEAPRFALVRVDRGDVLLTAACDLEPRRLELPEYARALAAVASGEAGELVHMPAVTVLATASLLDRLSGAGLLPATLFGLQTGLRSRSAVALRVGDGPDAAVAVRASALRQLSGGGLPTPEATVAVADGGPPGEPPAAAQVHAAARLIGLAAAAGPPPSPNSHTVFFEYRHIDMGETTFPWSGAEPADRLDDPNLVRVLSA
jgi:hypothetical protein